MDNTIPPKSDPRFTRPPKDAYSFDDNPDDEEISYARHQLVNEAINTQLINRLTGRGDICETLYASQPSYKFFAGALSDQYEYREAQDEGNSFQDIADDLSPFNMGVTFRVPIDIEDDALISVTPDASGYQRRLPTVKEQRNDELDGVVKEKEMTDEKVNTGGLSPEELVGGKKELLRVYERVECDLSSHSITGRELKEIAENSTGKKIPLDFTDAINTAKSIPRAYRKLADDTKKKTEGMVPKKYLRSNDSFSEYINEVYSDDVIEPLWEGELKINAYVTDSPTTDEEYISVEIDFINTYGREYPDCERINNRSWRVVLFDVGLNVDMTGESLIPFKSEEMNDKYQYDGDTYGVGKHCAIEEKYSGDDLVKEIETKTVPTYEQARYISRNPENIIAPMSVLGGEKGRDSVFDALEDIHSAMENAHTDYENIKSKLVDGKSETAADEFDEAIEEFEFEKERFKRGIECLRKDDRAYQSFILCNQAFDNHGFERWKLFQIVFIVMSIPDMLEQAAGVDDSVAVDFDSDSMSSEIDTADVIYFPTGGGKTEAYLGIVTFTAFHDRLRGKMYGMTAFTKFPLRFLSLQQLQRAANILAQAELLRRKHELGGEEFSVGYFVGKDNTPNGLIDDGKNMIKKVNGNDVENEEYLYVSTCPFCDSESVEITGDRDRGRIIHKCVNEECSEGELPVYISDNELYRYAPTFVVSTIDKISIIGMQRRMRTLFGQAKIKCEKHGYSGENSCMANERALSRSGECSPDDWEEVETVEPPSLIIQDELHLLRESFGAFASHYETFIQAYNSRITEGEWDTKVVAATATIEGAEKQVRGLYQKETNIFPEKGPRLRQSFYAYAHPVKKQRTMIGGLPRTANRSYALETVHEEYTRIIQEYKNDTTRLMRDVENIDCEFDLNFADFPSNSDTREEVLLDILTDYEVQVSYHNKKDNTDMMTGAVDSIINRRLSDTRDIYSEINSELLTGETDLSEVNDIMERLSKHDDPDIEDPVHMLIATSMISHGVDIDRLNFIAFFGLPMHTAEYIQSYSRVGRKWPGTVLVQHNPMKIRDNSYYTRFKQHQAYQDLLVEATPLERWAEFAIECTMPGIFCAALLQYYDFELEENSDIPKRVYMFDGFEEAARDKKISKEDMFEFVAESYGIRDVNNVDAESGKHSGVELYRNKIESEFNNIWDACQDPDNRIPEALAKDYSTDENNFIPTSVLQRDDEVRTPMKSLRDIDEQIIIGPDSTNAILISNFMEEK